MWLNIKRQTFNENMQMHLRYKCPADPITYKRNLICNVLYAGTAKVLYY